MSEVGIIQQETETTAAALYERPAAVNVWQDRAAFEQTLRVSNMLSKSSLVPQSYQGKPEDCFIAVEMAQRMNTSPLFIMQNLYVVKGKPSWAGQACMAMIIACGKFRGVRHVYTGTKGSGNRGCYVEAVRISDGETVQGTEVTLAMAQSEGWMSNSKWKNMPEQMLGYRAASFFARMYCPEAMMGLQTTEEIYDANPEKPGKAVAGSLAEAISGEDAQAPKTRKAKAAKQQAEPERVDRNVENGSAHGNGGDSPSVQASPEQKGQSPRSSALMCEECGNEIIDALGLTAEKIAQESKKKYGRCLCIECSRKAKKAQEAQQTDDLEAQLNAAAEE